MPEARLSGDVRGAFLVGVSAILIAALVDDGLLAWLLAPIYVGGLAYAALRAPLRRSLYVLTFCALVLEKPNEMPLWESPLFPLGGAMFLHLKNITGWSFLFLSGIECFIVLLAGVALFRAATGS
jgi:hypothetical protein